VFSKNNTPRQNSTVGHSGSCLDGGDGGSLCHKPHHHHHHRMGGMGESPSPKAAAA